LAAAYVMKTAGSFQFSDGFFDNRNRSQVSVSEKNTFETETSCSLIPNIWKKEPAVL
jgi:hypothetical protein